MSPLSYLHKIVWDINSEQQKSNYYIIVRLCDTACETYFMSFLDADTSNRTLPLSDISNSMNLSSNNSTLNNTEAKKIAALARHHRFQAEVTPRTAIRNFVEANQSEAQTPSNFFAQNSDSEVRSGTRRSLRQSKNGSDEATQNTTTEATILISHQIFPI